MKVRKVLQQDAEHSNLWREAHRVPSIPLDSLPPTGAVVESLDGSPLAMAWLYFSNSKLCYLAWPVTAPGLRPSLAKDALQLALRDLILLARATGMRYIVSTSSSRGLSKLLSEQGMIKQPLGHDLLTMEVI